MGEIYFRSAETSDRNCLMALTEECAGAPRWTPATWEQVLNSAARNERNVLIAMSGEQMLGFGVLGIAGDAAEIESLAVSPEVRRKGIGRQLCERLIRWTGTRGTNRVLLEVRASNRSARALYESLGFREIAVRKSYYRQPDEDGLVMAREL